MASILWERHLRDGFDLVSIGFNPVSGYDVPKENKLLRHELEFARLCKELISFKKIHVSLQVAPMVLFSARIDNNVVEVYNYILTNQQLETFIYERDKDWGSVDYAEI